MKQVLLRKGKISVADVPAPALTSRSILVEVSHSLISTGTELSTVQASGASLVERAIARPAAVVRALESIRVRGVKRTLSILQSRLDESQPLGYSCAGTVIAVGDAVTEFQAGDRVACAGAGLANHAEIISVPVTLAAKIPAGLDPAEASFVTLGAIALQGVRRADVRIGEVAAVVGLGLIGQITVQLLKAAGCRVIGLDPDPARVATATAHGLDAGATSAAQLKALAAALTGGHGVDATIIAASATGSDPARLSFHLTRKKGRIVVVGAVGMDLERSPFYEKEQDFLISCSYGPGRYDASYEASANDYPYAYVRWTENRNMRAFLDLAAAGKVKVGGLSSQSFPVSRAEEAYAALQADPRPLAVSLTFDGGVDPKRAVPPVPSRAGAPLGGKVRLGIIGLGAFTRTTHLPNLRTLGARAAVTALCPSTSASTASAASLAPGARVVTDYRDLLAAPDVDAVVIATRHANHAEMAVAALKAGKHVYLEKPLALTLEEVRAVDEAVRSTAGRLVFMVGFNRRFAPFTQELRGRLAIRATPAVVHYRVNAGALPAGHWANGNDGGGRLRGEACHMIDFFQAVIARPIAELALTPLRAGGGTARPDENFSAQVLFDDGSLCDLLYTSVGNAALPKERVELHWDGQSAVLDDYRTLAIHGPSPLSREGVPDKGHLAAMDRFLSAVAAGTGAPIPWEELHASAEATIALDAMAWGKAAAAE